MPRGARWRGSRARSSGTGRRRGPSSTASGRAVEDSGEKPRRGDESRLVDAVIEAGTGERLDRDAGPLQPGAGHGEGAERDDAVGLAVDEEDGRLRARL